MTMDQLSVKCTYEISGMTFTAILIVVYKY